jgi:choline-sulfatase
VARSLSEAGYATALIGKMHLGGRRQLAGFDERPYGDLTGKAGHQHDPPTQPGAGSRMRSRTADAGLTQIPESLLQEQVINTEAIAWLRNQRAVEPGRPWMTCLSYSRPHFPLTAPRRWWDHYTGDRLPRPKLETSDGGDTDDHPMTLGMKAGFQTEAVDDAEMMRARRGYFACVSYLDELIGDLLRLLQADGLLDDTVVIYTSDHGEMAGERGLWWKNSWHESAARVPLIVSLPEHRDSGWLDASGPTPRQRLDTPVSLADLYPTMCNLGGADTPDDLEGVDLSGAVSSGTEPDRPVVHLTNPTARWGTGTEHVVAVEGRHKLVVFRGADVPDLMFDLDADPDEQHNLLGGEPPADVAAVEARLREGLEQWWDFDAADRLLDEVGKASQQRKLPGGGNQYHMPDGRVVWAESPLYKPDVVADDYRELLEHGTSDETEQ